MEFGKGLIEELSTGHLLGSPLWRWLALAGTLAIAWALGLLARTLGRRRAARPVVSANATHHVVARGVAQSRALLWLLIGGWPALRWITVTPAIGGFVRGVAVIALGVQVALSLSAALQAALDKEREQREAEGRLHEVSSFGLLRAVGLAFIWSIGLLAVLSNLGVEITALVASLGVGGIAIALAAQNVLGDLLASLSIVLDRPFEVGDFITVGAEMGTVERIGLKTTRLRSLSGEQLVFGNNDLLTARVRNFKRMEERRVILRFGVLYSSDADLVEAVPGEVKGIIEAVDGVRFDRAHFAGFGESSLDFEAIYWILAPEYPVFMDKQQTVNLALLRRIREMGLDFAFPTRTLHIASGAPAAAAGTEATS